MIKIYGTNALKNVRPNYSKCDLAIQFLQLINLVPINFIVLSPLALHQPLAIMHVYRPRTITTHNDTHLPIGILGYMMTKSTTITSATNFDIPSLHLLLDEVDSILHDAEVHLSEFFDDEDEAPLLLDSAEDIAQLANIFHLIHFKGTAELAHAIAKVLKKLHDDGDNTNDVLIMDVSEGIMILGRYVEFVLLKEVLEPSLILPIINKLRAHIGEDKISNDELYKNNVVSIANPEKHYAPLSTLNVDKNAIITAVRKGLNTALDDDVNTASTQDIDALSKALQTVAAASDTLFWQAAAVATKNLSQLLPLNNANKRILIYLEQQLRDYLPISDKRFADLVGLAYSQNQEFMRMAQQKYGLHQLSTDEAKKLHRFLFGPNRQITDTVNILIQDTIESIKEQVDNLARGGVALNSTDNKDIAKQIYTLSQAMHLLGLQEAQKALHQSAKKVVAWQNPSDDDFDALLSDLMVAENAAVFMAKTHTPGAVKLPLHNHKISLHKLDEAYETLFSQSRSNIATAAQAIEDYSKDENFDLSNLQTVPEALWQVAGSANFLKMPKLAKMLDQLAIYTDGHILQDNNKPDEQTLCNMADVLMMADYHLEALEQNRPINTQSVNIAQQSLNRLLKAA